MDKTEFSLFVPTLIHYKQIDEYSEQIIKYRKEKDKDKFMLKFIKEFYESENIPDKKIHNIFDYGNNIMRYFRLTRYFKVSIDSSGYSWNIDLEPSRRVKIEQLLDMYNGEAFKFDNISEYLSYLSDISKPELPWENKQNLEKIAQSIKVMIYDIIKNETIEINQNEKDLLLKDTLWMNKNELENYITHLRNLNLVLKDRIKKIKLMNDINKINDIIQLLRDLKKLRKYEPEQFEKLITEALKIINDEISIKPNFPVDDDGEPISHSPGNQPDIECIYSSFKAICEVTLNTSKLQWVMEGQPIMRHLRNFEDKHQGNEIFCLFIAPRIHMDTYSQFWISVKYEYDGKPQKNHTYENRRIFDLVRNFIISYEKGAEIYP